MRNLEILLIKVLLRGGRGIIHQAQQQSRLASPSLLPPSPSSFLYFPHPLLFLTTISSLSLPLLFLSFFPLPLFLSPSSLTYHLLQIMQNPLLPLLLLLLSSLFCSLVKSEISVTGEGLVATRPDECSVSFGVGKKRRREGRERAGKRGEGREREDGRGREVREREREEKGEKFRRVVLFLNFL